jgi:hypothetical protein
MITFVFVILIFVLGLARLVFKKFNYDSSAASLLCICIILLGIMIAIVAEVMVGAALPTVTTTETHQLEVVISHPDRDIYLDRLEGYGNEMYIYVVTENGQPDLRWVNADIDKVRIVYDSTGGAWYEITSVQPKERWYLLFSFMEKSEESMVFHLPPGGADIGE